MAVLVALMLAAASIDLVRRGTEATRWKEYAFVLAAGLIAGIFGLANNLVTSSISPEYFIFGKAVPTESISRGAALLGLKAGFVVGIFSGGLCVYVATRKSAYPPFSLRNLMLLSWRPFVIAVTFAVLLPLMFGKLDPLGFEAKLNPPLKASQVSGFVRVWWIHLGVYVGLMIGVLWVIFDVAGIRRREVAPPRP